MVLEKTLESPLDCKEIQPIHSKGDQPWDFFGRNDAKTETPVLLPGNSHGWRSLVGCSPWDQEESDMAKRLHFHFSLSCTGEGNGNPLQYSCLGNFHGQRSLAGYSQFSSVAQSCPTLCNPMNRSIPSLPVHHQLLEFTQTHVH